MLRVGFKTDKGLVRDNNEDAILVLPKRGMFAVADGVGGQNSGEIASRKAVNSIEEFVKRNSITCMDSYDSKYKVNWLMNYFLRCFQKINSDIVELSKEDSEKSGMATTAVVAYIDGLDLYVVNIGDSRAYVLRDGQINQITEDHTYVNNLIHQGALTKNEARIHPQKNLITKALGAEKGVEPDFYRTELMEGDKVILCSDGLHGELTDDEMTEILDRDADMNQICRELVNGAKEKGGRDNISVICIQI